MPLPGAHVDSRDSGTGDMARADGATPEAGQCGWRDVGSLQTARPRGAPPALP